MLIYGYQSYYVVCLNCYRHQSMNRRNCFLKLRQTNLVKAENTLVDSLHFFDVHHQSDHSNCSCCCVVKSCCYMNSRCYDEKRKMIVRYYRYYFLIEN